MTFDQYNFCSLGCTYCFAYFFKSNNPSISKIELKAVDADRMIEDMQGRSTRVVGRTFYEHFYSKRVILHWGGLADPFCSFEKTNGVGLKLIDALGEMSYPTLFSFKGPTIFEPKYVKRFEKFAHQRNFAFQVSIVTGDDELAKLVEIGVPSPTQRLRALKMLSDMGYWTVLRLRPYIIGVSDQHLDRLLERALEAGIKGISAEFMAIDARSNVGMKSRYAWLAKLIGVKDMHRYFQKLSPSERGGYMRLNRMVKERHVRKIYNFCKKHDLVCGISDPDFKELNTSGSCCALPNRYKPNKEMSNWTRSQLTFHLKEARQEFHRTGKAPVLKFGTVYGSESYLDDTRLANDHVRVIGMCCADRMALTQRTILQEIWNNLDSPANPRNYFHGKLMPTGTDREGNLLFQYTPSEYEARWKEEGVSLE
jgi:DNA repair photolyase